MCVLAVRLQRLILAQAAASKVRPAEFDYMAQIVGGFGVPHTPVFPHFVKRDGPDCEIAKLFGAQKERACGGAARRHRDVRHRPSQHLLPRQPADLRAGRRQDLHRRRTTSRATCRTTWCRRRPISPRISARPAIEAGFDVGMTQNFSVDHSVTVPLHFLTPDMNIPVVPFFISGHVPPLPSAQRCYALGQAVGRAIESWPENKRVVVMGSRQLLAGSRRPAHGARPHRRRARSGLVRAGHQISGRASRSTR